MVKPTMSWLTLSTFHVDTNRGVYAQGTDHGAKWLHLGGWEALGVTASSGTIPPTVAQLCTTPNIAQNVAL